MSKFFETEEFKRLHAEWREKLKASKFEDHEDPKGNLKTYDRRTIAWDNMNRIKAHFDKFASYLRSHPELPQIHHQVLSLYFQNVKSVAIAKSLGLPKTKVREIITVYREIIKALDA